MLIRSAVAYHLVPCKNITGTEDEIFILLIIFDSKFGRGDVEVHPIQYNFTAVVERAEIIMVFDAWLF